MGTSINAISMKNMEFHDFVRLFVCLLAGLYKYYWLNLKKNQKMGPGPVFTNILILRIRIFLEFFLENSKDKYFWYSLNSYS